MSRSGRGWPPSLRRPLRRGRARWRLRRHLGLWYHTDYAPPCLARSGRAPGIVLERVERAVGQLEAEGLLRAGDLRPPPAASFDDLGLVHPPRYLAESAHPEVLARIFALGERELDADELLRAQRRAVGGTVAAAQAVATGRRRVGFNLGGGFHHAEPDLGGGFCLYNDIAVAVARLRREGFDAPVAVVDLDFHQGNGNLAALEDDPGVLHFSIEGSVWRHDGAKRAVQHVLPSGTGDDRYLQVLRASLPEVLAVHRPAIVFYVAGNDVLEGDPLGGFALTPRGVLERDLHVARCASSVGAGLVVTLGGGYRSDAWRCTANFLRWLLAGAQDVGVDDSERLRERFARVAAGLDLAALQDGHAPLTEADVLADLHQAAPVRFLDYYSVHGVEYVLERYGIVPRLRGLGFADLRVALDLSDRERQVLRVHGRRPPGGPVLLMELVAGRRVVVPPLTVDGASPLEVLAVEWLLLQDPTTAFSLSRPRLPGQRHPGLGISEEVQGMLVQECNRLGLDGILSRPAHFHNAAGAPDFHFLDPEAEGRCRAFAEALAGEGIPAASWLIEEGAVGQADGETVRWEPAEHVLPVSKRMSGYFADPEYVGRRDAATERWRARGIRVAAAVSRGPDLPDTDARSRAAGSGA